ncbi:MAG: hypothetical protein QOK40_939 [Miltoncostaeaceae bacterium]|nr:hypothetical protein [Miltoncostaeaceae bacterium]
MALAGPLVAGAPAAVAAIPIPTAVRMNVAPARDAIAPYVFTVTGRLVFRLPTPGGACAGVVSMAIKANGLPVLLKSPKVGADCRFTEVFRVPRRAKLHGARKLVIAGLWFRFGAPTSVIAPARTVRIR